MQKPLFGELAWFAVAENQKAAMKSEVLALTEHQVLNTPVDDLCDYLVDKYAIDVPLLKDDEIVIDQKDTQIDVSGDRMRLIRDRSQPFYVSGTVIEASVPFTGEAEAFKIRPTSFTSMSPHAEVGASELLIQVTGTSLTAEQVRSSILDTARDIGIYLENLRRDVQGLSDQLRAEAKTQLEQRRQKFLADRNLVASIGFPLKRRDAAPQTYRAPEIRRRVQLRPPATTTEQYRPEPALEMAEYENILSIMTNMALVMERSPAAFATMGEEDLRMQFLVQLNGQYEGEATGETFNLGGKTDILIRSNGKNSFIAECKFWGGPKTLLETVDQLLRYTSWRDTKAAMIIFNRQKNFSRVLASIAETMPGHPQVKRVLPKPSETSFRYVLGQPDDPNRELILTVLAFDVPQAGGQEGSRG